MNRVPRSFGRRSALVAVAVTVACLANAVPTLGATLIGQNSMPSENCGAGLVGVQDTTAAPPLYSVPAGGGVVTSWMHLAPAGGKTLQLKLVRRTGASTYLVIGQSALELLVAGSNTFSTRIPVQAGDLLALYTPSGTACALSTAASGDVAKTMGGSPSDPAPVGATLSAPNSVPSTRLAIAANVEADADGDQFGDETQDGCPTNASAQGACPTSPTPPPLLPGDCANVTNGTAGSDTLTGTAAGDRLLGLTGNDILNGLAGNDCLEGDAGKDLLSGSSGNDRLVGGSGGDSLSGGLGNDDLAGGASNDRMNGGPGNDVVDGASGADSLKGGPGNDRISAGSGKNTISAGSGNDTITAANGRTERISCGGGRDKVTADRRDRLVGCERVKRTS